MCIKPLGPSSGTELFLFSWYVNCVDMKSKLKANAIERMLKNLCLMWEWVWIWSRLFASCLVSKHHLSRHLNGFLNELVLVIDKLGVWACVVCTENCNLPRIKKHEDGLIHLTIWYSPQHVVSKYNSFTGLFMVKFDRIYVLWGILILTCNFKR